MTVRSLWLTDHTRLLGSSSLSCSLSWRISFSGQHMEHDMEDTWGWREVFQEILRDLLSFFSWRTNSSENALRSLKVAKGSLVVPEKKEWLQDQSYSILHTSFLLFLGLFLWEGQRLKEGWGRRKFHCHLIIKGKNDSPSQDKRRENQVRLKTPSLVLTLLTKNTCVRRKTHERRTRIPMHLNRTEICMQEVSNTWSGMQY
jgi:hypothetical protein